MSLPRSDNSNPRELGLSPITTTVTLSRTRATYSRGLPPHRRPTAPWSERLREFGATCRLGVNIRGRPWFRLAPILILLFAQIQAVAADSSSNLGPTVVIVVGASGEALYATNFARQSAAWSTLTQRTGAHAITLGLDSAQTNDLEILQQFLAIEPRESSLPLVLVLIGHGTFDGREAKFNLRGPDLTTTNLQEWLAPFHRPLAIIHTGSASAPFLNRLSGTNRVLISATRSGNEQNATRFGGALADALADPKSDLDQDGETSLLEAFLSAATRVAEFYKTEGRLATEHPLIDDNGDRLGTPAEWFRGTRATKKPLKGATSDGFRAHQFALVPGPESQRLSPEQRARRDELELTIARMREGRPSEPDDEYYQRLEVVLLELAKMLPPPP